MPRQSNPLPQLIRRRFTKLCRDLTPLAWAASTPLEVEGSRIFKDPQPLTVTRGLALKPVQSGERFGPARGGWHQRWFRLRIPAADSAQRGKRFLSWDCDGETTVYVDGKPWAGLDVGHFTCPLPDKAATLWLDCSTWQTGIWVPGSRKLSGFGLEFREASIKVRDEDAWALRWDLDALEQMLTELVRRDGLDMPAGGQGFAAPLWKCSPLLRLVLRGVDEVCDAYVEGGVKAALAATRALRKRLPAETWQPTAAICGHAHIDLVWLWPEMAAERKAVHSFASMCRILDAYPEARFVQSMPAAYRAVERLAPSLIKDIRERIKRGQWEVMGGFEVEPDVNLPSGEALARSLVYGQRKIADFMGKPSDVCWIPDVFGYSNCLPQILALGGVRNFYTTKMTWSVITKFPYNSFVWRGADGSEVVAHLASLGYNNEVGLKEHVDALRGHAQADVHPEMLIGTGYGDGGGGVNEMMCERARRFENLAASPRVKWSDSAAFFRRLQRVRDKLPVYQGELYLEYHRGTYTTQSDFKRLYRATETALQVREAVRVAHGGEPIGEAPWLRPLFGQFHDALPGSSIRRVYAELNSEYETYVKDQLAIATKELRAKGQGEAVVFNPLPIGHRRVVEKGGRGKPMLVDLQPVSAVPARSVEPANPLREASPTTLDNGRVKAGFDARGRLRRLSIDGRAVRLAGPMLFSLYHDNPANYDAWDIDQDALSTQRDAFDRLTLRVAEDSPLRAVLEGDAQLGTASSIKVRYVLEADSPYLRVEVDADWHESHRMLKAHLVTDYRGRRARFGCPFGSIDRPQLPGTEQDEAMWEVPASRWAAVMDDDGDGAAILTEAKFGFGCRDGDLSLTLLRSAKYPDEAADMGRHTMRFALGRFVSHATADQLSTPVAADALFTPLPVLSAGKATEAPFVLEDLGSLAPSWCAPSETGRGYFIRFHETAGSRGEAQLRFARKPRSVTLVDFNEKKQPGKVARQGDVWRLAYEPYKVLTVLVRS